MKFSVTLPGSIRSKKNSKQPCPIPCKPGSQSTIFKKFKTGMRPVRITLQPSKAYRVWEKEARRHVKACLQGVINQPFGTPIKNVKVTAYFKGQQPDLSGVLESVGDCLEGIVWENDRQIEAWDGSRLFHDLKNPRTLVEVEI